MAIKAAIKEDKLARFSCEQGEFQKSALGS